MLLTRKQKSVLRLRREGFGPTAIARAAGMNRVTVSRILSRAKRNLRNAGIDPDKALSPKDHDLMDLAG
jgi:transcriptional regulator